MEISNIRDIAFTDDGDIDFCEMETVLHFSGVAEAFDVDVIKQGALNGVNVPYSTYYNQVDQRINQKMSVWINGDMTSREFVDYMDESMRLGMEGKL